MAKRTIYLADHGQGFLEFDIDVDGVVTAARPSHDWLWIGVRVTNHAKLAVGMHPVMQRTGGVKPTLLNYPVADLSEPSQVAA